MSKLIDKIKNSITAEMLFFTAFISRLVIATWDTTMFPQVGIIRKIALVLVLVCATAKIVFYNTHTLSEIIVISICGFCAIMNMIKSGSNVFLILFLLVVAAQNIDFRKILQIYLAVVGSIVGFAFICSLGGVIENLRYWVLDGFYYRNSFGITYCTDFAAHVFFLVLAYYYIRAEKLKMYEHIATLCIAGFVYFASRGKLDSLSLLVTVIVFEVGNLIAKKETVSKVLQYGWKSVWKSMTPVFMCFCSVIMMTLTYGYKEDISWMSTLNEFISHRLSIGSTTINENGFKLFGQQILLQGYGGSIYLPDGSDYNFVDCSYLYVLVASGLVILVIVLLAYMYGCHKNCNDLYLLYAIAILSVNCMIAHHLLDISFNPFTFMIMAVVIPKLKEKEEYVSSKVQCYINF